MNPDTESAAPGRSCPLRYRYRPEDIAQAEVPAGLRDLDVLYVVGGLYGNEPALQQVLRLFERERGRRALVFNGDFHWFDIDPAVFARVQREVLAHAAQRGNVETEIAAVPVGDLPDDMPGADAGCGCAYPAWVGDAVVERSNRILARLRGAAGPAQRAELAALPMWQPASVGPWRVGLVHGDAESLAGWGFAQEHLAEAARREAARRWCVRAGVQAFACSHTCLPVFCELSASSAADATASAPEPAFAAASAPAPAGERWVLNNGAAGMPNFGGDPAGLLTRVALSPFEGRERRFGVRRDEVFAEGIAIEYDADAWRRRFLADWPAGSDAHASYHQRIERGPAYCVEEALRTRG
ncbi:MAG: hypothetical protein HZC37_21460 [Burkholderiales bacterium]|nr:hypothetical protein [Burkholderiales bacterium]